MIEVVVYLVNGHTINRVVETLYTVLHTHNMTLTTMIVVYLVDGRIINLLVKFGKVTSKFEMKT